MSNFTCYDPCEDIPSPSIDALNEWLNLSSNFDFNMNPTPDGTNPSHHSNSNSPSHLTELPEIYPFVALQSSLDFNKCQSSNSHDNLGTTLPSNNNFQSILMKTNYLRSPLHTDITIDASLEPEDEKLRILAQPKSFYRDRYPCETDPKKNRAQRYIRAEDGKTNYEYPTVEIPKKWRHSTRQIYIRVTSITIENELVPYHCIHPYEIDTPDKHVIKDLKNNSLYFRVRDDELITGVKSFQITRKKMIQHDLKLYGPLRLFRSNQPDLQVVMNAEDTKRKIITYQLWKSQLAFTITELNGTSHWPVPIAHTMVKSQIMIDGATNQRNTPINIVDDKSKTKLKCVPQKGDWKGGDEVVIIMPKPTKRKVYNICFDFGSYGQQTVKEIECIDTKTLAFRTPSCPILPDDENIKASIIIRENNSTLYSTDFYYLTPTKVGLNLCSHCQSRQWDDRMNNKRKCEYKESFENDDGHSLLLQMEKLSVEKKTSQSHVRIASYENNSKVEKYLNRLKAALEKFIRTNDPSRLFRQVRALLTRCDESPPPLNEAIQRGHTQLALPLIEQVLDMSPSQGVLEKQNENGETPLLIAAKLNQWKLMEPILRNRLDLVQHKDKAGNNILHLLAEIDEDEGAATIQNVIKILPNDPKELLLKEKNQAHQTPLEIAQSHPHQRTAAMLSFSIDVENKY
ncbi:unnamed protein product [Rotaria magnacalcarata]|uniref:Uncharacterized protein n=1 Tax=Rotaria magnacalcarata TaxID=392030 RepID=A0A819UE48_9BILA|nr:unnamed protein product [Rotaria magnacalcarata]CAF4093667.1 unnamed protein product [Rotaria magnacalcarata]